MLVSIALAPCVLRPPAAHSPSLIRSLSAMLHAVSQNGIIVCPDALALRADLVQAAAAASGPAAQRFRLVATDVAKEIERYSASPGNVSPGTATGSSLCAECVSAARWGRCDAVVVLDDPERQLCIAAGAPPERIVPLEDFGGSSLDLKRSGWLTAQRLDTLARPDALALVGSAIRFSKKIVVADKMIGVAAKDGAAKATKHLRGVAYLVDAWSAASPHASAILEVEIVSVAGGSGARAGFIDPVAARTAITNAMTQLGTLSKLGGLTITLKQDDDPQVFNDRLLVCGTRVWGIHHGFDDLGKLLPTRPGSPTSRLRPTRIEPSSDALATTYRDIRALRDA